jgi:hypothetical protein
VISLFFVILVCVAVVLVATSGNINLALPPATAADRPRNAKLGALVARYDPTRDWKREHRIALIGAVSLGAFVCFVFAFMHTKAPHDWMGYALRYNSLSRQFDVVNSFIPSAQALSYLLGLTLWTAFGGIVGGSIVGITLLLRK